jgi:hypothetical protein
MKPKRKKHLYNVSKSPPPINRLKTVSHQQPESYITGNIQELPIIAIKYLIQNKISYSVIQSCFAQRVLPGTMESHTDHPHLKAKKTS